MPDAPVPVSSSVDTTAGASVVGLRPPEMVMRLDRMGCSWPTRLSFARSLLRDLAADGAETARTLWDIDDNGWGTAVYSIGLGGHDYSLVAFSNELDPADRTDRVIAERWDAAFVLFDGRPDTADIERLRTHAPRQEAGRFAPTDLVLSRANRSVRFFDHVVDRLADGHQPDRDLLGAIGYLMRTTAVYGNGKFGIADRSRVAHRDRMAHPFRLEMLTVWLIRTFTIDLAEHVAARRAPTTAVGLAPDLRRHLGVGNATGLGMAPFLASHPILINNWALARETALAEIVALPATDRSTAERVEALAGRVVRHLREWNVDDTRQMRRIEIVREEAAMLTGLLTPGWWQGSAPWAWLRDMSADWSLEGQELIVALLLEAHPDIADGPAQCMYSVTTPTIDPTMALGDLVAEIEQSWQWALAIDFRQKSATAQFWYTSEEKLEPRIGRRHEEPGAELERPLDIARRVQALHRELTSRAGHDVDTTETQGRRSLATFLLNHPEHRFAVRRVQTAGTHPYGEIRNNLIGDECLPIDMLRWKLAMFGASKFDPKSTLWTRITLFQGAPLPDDLARADVDDWWLPVLGPEPSPAATP